MSTSGAPRLRVDRADPERRLAELARSRGALRRVLAGLAAALVRRKGWTPLGYARAGDYARERLGLSGRSLHDLARVGRALADLPQLEAALASGTLPWSKARLLARFVVPDDEAVWIARARCVSCRTLEREVRAVDRGVLTGDGLRVDEDGASDEPVETVQVRVGSALYFKWQRMRTWAARVAGERVAPGAVLEMVTAEALSALPAGAPWEGVPDGAFRPDGGFREREVRAPPPRGDGVDAVTAEAPQSVVTDPPTERCLPPFLQPLLAGLDAADAFEIDTRLRRAVRLEQRLDAEIAPLLRRVASSEHVWDGRPETLARLAREHLGMSPRKARALLRLERAGDVCPELRAAWRDGAVSWVQAQILTPLLLADVEGDWRTGWLRLAGQVTVRRLEEVVGRALALQEADPEGWEACREDPSRVLALPERAAARAASNGRPERQTCARPERQTCARPMGVLQGIRLRVTAPTEVTRLFRAVLCSLRRVAEARTGHLPREDEAFEAMLDHALHSWGVRVPKRFAVFERDGWRCTVPGCTAQRNLHTHHIRFRSAGGSDEPTNLTTLCAAHHHRGVHAGAVRIGGNAPEGLWFELGVRPGQAPLARYRSGDRVA